MTEHVFSSVTQQDKRAHCVFVVETRRTDLFFDSAKYHLLLSLARRIHKQNDFVLKRVEIDASAAKPIDFAERRKICMKVLNEIRCSKYTPNKIRTLVGVVNLS